MESFQLFIVFQVVVIKTPTKDNQVNGNKTSTENSLDSDETDSKDHSKPTEVTNNHTVEEKLSKLNLNMSVHEYRSKLAMRKKYDPKKEAMDVKKKHEIIDTL